MLTQNFSQVLWHPNINSSPCIDTSGVGNLLKNAAVFFAQDFWFKSLEKIAFFGVSQIHNLKYVLNVNFPFSGRKRVEGIGSW